MTTGFGLITLCGVKKVRKDEKVVDSGAIYDVKGMNKGKVILLGVQHTFAMFGATVLVPLLTG